MLEGFHVKKGKDTARFIIDWMGTGRIRKHIEANARKKSARHSSSTGYIPDVDCLRRMQKMRASIRRSMAKRQSPSGGCFPLRSARNGVSNAANVSELVL